MLFVLHLFMILPSAMSVCSVDRSLVMSLWQQPFPCSTFILVTVVTVTISVWFLAGDQPYADFKVARPSDALPYASAYAATQLAKSVYQVSTSGLSALTASGVDKSCAPQPSYICNASILGHIGSPSPDLLGFLALICCYQCSHSADDLIAFCQRWAIALKFQVTALKAR